MKKINLVIFNEPYWDKGLVYSQNILPLLRLLNTGRFKLQLISFTSIPLLWVKRKEIKLIREELRKFGVDIKNYPVFFYPTRFMLLRYFLILYYFVNVFPYIVKLNKRDKKESIDYVYSIRSYQAALGFLKFYYDKKRIIFDTRTDWIEENINVGNFKKDGITVRYWQNIEKQMLVKFKKTLFISERSRNFILKRNGLEQDEKRYCVVYNPIDYNHFQSVKKEDVNENFLYTGTLGHWNDISIYFDFFLIIANALPSSKLIVCTSSPTYKIIPVLNTPKYHSLKERVEIYFNVPYTKLPIFYARCTYGLQLMNKKDTRVGVKFVEYVAAGLIPIVNTNVMGAVDLVKKYNIGVVVDDVIMKDVKLLLQTIREAKMNIVKENIDAFKQITDLNQIENSIIPIYD